MILEHQTRTTDSGVTIVELRGRLTLGNSLRNAEEDVKKIASAPNSKTILDLSGLDFVDSAGIGMLIMCNSAAMEAGGKLHISGAVARVKEAFQITKVHYVLSLFDTLEAALAAL
jgi:anti-sigma B factor antagonist